MTAPSIPPPTTELVPRDASTLDPLVQPQCSLSVHLRRVTGSVVGRTVEVAAIEQQLTDAASHLLAVTLEGEPGIGKTRLLLATAEMAERHGFTPVAVTADEEIRGPFLLAQSIFASPAIRDLVVGTPEEAAVNRAVAAISGRDEPGLETLSPDAKLLRVFDLASVALGAVARLRPLALLVDDVQWADDDTVRLLRYLVRTATDRPIFLFLSLRPDEFGTVSEAVNFVADMERMGVVHRLRVGRFSPTETAQLLRQMLGGSVDPASAEAIHVQSEGVPFIVEEVARTYREAALLQQIDGTWRLNRNTARLIPSAVRTLIQRRAARLGPETRAVLAEAAILGRSFSLRDLAAVRARIDSAADDGVDLGEALTPAVQAGLLLQHQSSSPADFTFTHEQVREFAAADLPQARSRLVHRALVDLLLEAGDPAPAGLPMLARHALAAGDSERAARFSIDAARAALQSNAPEEALRLVEQALAAVSTPEERRQLLTIRDDAYAVLRRAADRLDGLAELGALVEALRDLHLELDVQLRRVSALRLGQDYESAAELARRIRARAGEIGDREMELRANLELGQSLLRAPLGESFGGVASETDPVGAEEAYQRAAALGEETGDDRSQAAALRELGTIGVGRMREWFGEQLKSGRAIEFGQRVAAGESVEQMLQSFPIFPQAVKALEEFQKALELYERVGDRTGAMSTIIAMAYINYAPVIHLTSSARHLEEIRRVISRMTTLVTESERARLELQLLYGVHVYARAKIVPDLMLSRGEEAYRLARMLGDRFVEFLAAGGVAMAHLGMGEQAQASEWIDRASRAVAAAPTPERARQLEVWRGMCAAAAGDAAGMRSRLELAVRMAAEQGQPAARCEALACLALQAARLGAEGSDEELLALAERSAREAKEVLQLLPGHAPWGAQADAAVADVAMARGEPERAAAAARAALDYMETSLHEDTSLEILLPAARALLAAGPPDIQEMVRSWLGVLLARIAQGTADEEMRVRWLRGPVGRELVRLAGPVSAPKPAAAGDEHPEADQLEEVDRSLMRLLTQGSTNREMAEELHLEESVVTQRLAKLLAGMGATTRAEATSLAFRGLAFHGG